MYQTKDRKHLTAVKPKRKIKWWCNQKKQETAKNQNQMIQKQRRSLIKIEI